LSSSILSLIENVFQDGGFLSSDLGQLAAPFYLVPAQDVRIFELASSPLRKNVRIAPKANRMDLQELKRLLAAYKSGDVGTDEAARQISNLHFEDIGYARVDHARVARQGFPEVVFGAGKTRAQVVGIVERLVQRAPNVIVTHTDEGTFGEVRNVALDAEWHETARLIRIQRDRTERGVGPIVVVTAGTSDILVAEEAALVAEAMGNRVERIWDAGVAGIHRVLAERSLLQRARVIIVAAGMEGALPSVVGGLVSVPVVAIPTSIGYGASFGGVAALLGMLNSCASNVTVVNIDNGFGAGFVASLINRRWEAPSD
jgi:pyridinium-3,5-biscarboxylic acid mononucleotide synthase